MEKISKFTELSGQKESINKDKGNKIYVKLLHQRIFKVKPIGIPFSNIYDVLSETDMS